MNNETYRELLAKLYQLLANLNSRAKEAGVLLAKLVDADPTTIKTILRDSPVPQSRGNLERLLRLGRSQLHEALYNDDSDKSKIVSELPYEEQVRFIETGIFIAIKTPTGDPQFVKRRYLDATLFNVRTACCGRRLRTREEQLEFLRQVARTAERIKKQKIGIENGKLVVRDKDGYICAQFTVAQLEKWTRLLREARPSKK